MRYKKIRLDFKYCERGRFYRTLLVKEDLNLVNLGCAIVVAFNGAFEHEFLFNIKGLSFLPKSFLEYHMSDDEYMGDYNLEALGDSFNFTYDTGDGWDFKGKVYKRIVELDNEEEVVLIDGAGQGIWEDNIHSLDAYLNGEIDDEYNPYEDDAEYTLPWNLECDCFSDFDNAFNLAEEQECFYGIYLSSISLYHDKEESSFDLDDCFDNEVLDEDLELFNELDEEEVNERLHEHVIKAVDEQIESLEYVEDTYVRLCEKYSMKEAKNLIATCLLNEMFAMMINEREFDEEAYKKASNEIE